MSVAGTARVSRILGDLEVELGRATGGEVGAVEGLEPFGDGHSGFTYLTSVLDRGERQQRVLRLSPPGARIAGPADVGRQGRIMRELAASEVPVPAVTACSSEPVVDDRAYMLIERVVGIGVAELRETVADAEIAARAIEVLRNLHRFPLDSEAPVADEEELERWARLLPRVPAEVRDAAEPLLAALRGGAPGGAPARVHGDYHYGNLLFRDGEVVALLDWEIASSCSPLWDLGSLVVASLRRRYASEPNSMGGPEVDPAWLLERYGADPEEARWYVAASCLKYAAIIGYNFELHRTGRREDEEYTRLLQTMRGLPDDGMAILGLGERSETLIATESAEDLDPNRRIDKR